MVTITIPATLYVDRWGRRTSGLVGGIILSSSMFIIGALYLSDSVHPYGIARWVVVILIFVFALTYCATWAIMGKIYASEIQPMKIRNEANSLAQGVSFVSIKYMRASGRLTNDCIVRKLVGGVLDTDFSGSF